MKRMMMIRNLQSPPAGLILALWLLQGCGGPDKAAQIDEVVTAEYENNQFIGTVLVAEHGKVIYRKSFGYANHEWEIPNEPEAKYRIASMTKQFTSMLVLQLVQEGRMSLEATVRDYLPEICGDGAYAFALPAKGEGFFEKLFTIHVYQPFVRRTS